MMIFYPQLKMIGAEFEEEIDRLHLIISIRRWFVDGLRNI